jgi:ribosome-binding factor A
MKSRNPSQRQLRVAELVRHALTQLLQRGEVPDPAIENSLLSITEVAMSPDLKIATVFIAPLGGGDPQPLVRALARNARLIRGKLSPAIGQIRYMPEFRFRADESFDNYSRIDELLHRPEVARDLDEGGNKSGDEE